MIFPFFFLPLFLIHLINSLLKSGHDFEIIVIDDASPDQTLEIAKELQKLYGENRIVNHL